MTSGNRDPKYLDAFRFLEATLEAKLFKPNKIEVLPKGLLSVDDGWNRQRAHKVRRDFSPLPSRTNLEPRTELNMFVS